MFIWNLHASTVHQRYTGQTDGRTDGQHTMALTVHGACLSYRCGIANNVVGIQILLLSNFTITINCTLQCLYRKTTDTGLVHRAVCLFTSQLSLLLIAPTHGWGWPG